MTEIPSRPRGMNLTEFADLCKKYSQEEILSEFPDFSEINKKNIVEYISSLSDSQLLYESRKFDLDNLDRSFILIPSDIHPDVRYLVDVCYYLDLVDRRINILFD